MKTSQRFYISLLFIIFSILIDFNSLVFAEYSHFQVGLSSGCSVYESIYKGITCRNASLTDTPVCDDTEDILNSPRRSKLCCCTRVLEEESKNNNGNCLDVGCQNLNVGGKCEEGFLMQEFEGNKGPVPCCCLPKPPSICTLLGCNNGGISSGNKCLSDEPITSFSTKGTSLKPSISNGTPSFACCCKNGAANKEAINAFTCKNVIGECQEPRSTTEPICPNDLISVNVSIYVKNGSVVPPPPSNPPPPPLSNASPSLAGKRAPLSSRESSSSTLDLGTVAKTMPCCCKY